MKKKGHTKEKKPQKILVDKEIKQKAYILKKNTTMKFLRVIFWGILIFLLIKGIVVSFRPDNSVEVREMIKNFKEEYGILKDESEGIYSFTKNFVKEYLTYSNDFEEEYKERIKPYVVREIYNMPDILDFKGNTEVLYVEAYRKEDYTENRSDVYVLADIRYSIQKISEDGEDYDTIIEEGRSILKVPVYKKNNKFIVEDLPLFVQDDVQLDEENYTTEDVYMREMQDDQEKEVIKEMLNNFFTAYYKDEQGIIDYYISPDAEKENFIGLNGRYLFKEIKDIQILEGEGSKTCIIKVNIVDGINGATIQQRFCLNIIKDKDHYYVKDITTKSKNLGGN